MKLPTRKNPYWMGFLIIFQAVFGVYFLARVEPNLFMGGFLIWACGCNCGWAASGNPPDAFQE